MADAINAFVPGPRVTIEGAPNGPLAALTFTAKDLFDVVARLRLRGVRAFVAAGRVAARRVVPLAHW
jgi:hypothetical protein